MVSPAKSAIRVLIVDDDRALLRLLEAILDKGGYEVTAEVTAETAIERVSENRHDLVLSDIQLPGKSGLDLLGEIRRRAPNLPVILMTAHGSIDDAVDAMRLGANDYITKPLDAEDVNHRVRQALRLRSLEAENRWLHDELAAAYRPGRIVAVSAVMREVVGRIEKLAASDSTILLTGESGTGKELLARALHYGGPRSQGPFIALNCAALPATLVESELFGHARGSFTGASKDHPGKLETAHRGTLFLDEIGEMPLEIQPKLLRALQERAFERVGEHKLRRVDVRFVAATNRDLAALVKEGQFREDLYYRLAVVPVHVPPLRERREDITPLARFLLRQMAGDEAPELTEDAISELAARGWPGNVRELANVLEHTLALHDDGPILAAELPAALAGLPSREATPSLADNAGSEHIVELPAGGASLDDMVRALVVQALERKSWNQSAAARLLRIPRHVLQYRMAKYGIVREPA